MITVELGHLALTLAVMAALAQALLPLIIFLAQKTPPIQEWVPRKMVKKREAQSIHEQNYEQNAVQKLLWLRDFSVPLACLQAVLVLFAFFCLLAAFARSDFSTLLVYQHSHSLKPLLYKLTGLWGNHEGSMLLWLLVMVIFGALLALLGSKQDIDLRFYALSVQGGSVFLFGMFILLTSNSFLRALPMPTEGLGLNPILQDPGLAFHPPTLYIGYVGLSTVFSLAIGGLLNRKIDAYWAKTTRIFAMLAWLFLTAGIALGSYWAYYELGWGGFWFWDPVENSSLMPWLLCTALVHSLAVVQKSSALKRWTVFLSLTSFGLSLIGTFLVRSGIVTSVHSFANDPQRGLFILLIIAMMLVAGFVLYGKRGQVMQDDKQFGLLTRESFLIFNNVFLLAMAGTVFLGTFYPLGVEIFTQQRISIGTPYYNATFVPIMLATLCFMGGVPAMYWQISGIGLLTRRLRVCVPLILGFTLGMAWLNQLWQIPAFLGFLSGGWVGIHALLDLWQRGFGSNKLGIWAMNIAHIGLSFVILGVVVASVGSGEKILTLEVGEEFAFKQYQFKIIQLQNTLDASQQDAKNYRVQRVEILAKSSGGKEFLLVPEKRFYPVHNQETTEAGIKSFFTHDIYLSLGDIQTDIQGQTHIVVRIYYKPLISLIWLGAMLMVIAALLSLLRHSEFLQRNFLQRILSAMPIAKKGHFVG